MTTTSTVRNDPVHTNIVTEAWPRLMAWLDGLSPGDSGLTSSFPHSMRMEEYVKDGTFVARVELPGFDPDKDIQVEVDGRQLTIEAKREEKKETDQRSEFSYGRFVRTTTLPSGADPDSVKAEYRDGILEITLKLSEATTSSRKVQVQRAS